MRKSGYVIAAIAAITVVAPSIASADTVVIKHRNHDWRGAHAEFREHRDYGLHRGFFHRDRDRDRDRVIIREHRGRFDRDRY